MTKRVLVVGAGPAGASTAIFLSKLGIAVDIVDRREPLCSEPGALPKIGESLPPDAGKLLRQLGAWEAFEAGPHLRCSGNKSYWGARPVQYHDFINHPQGHGWHIDRHAFEQQLREKAASDGAQIFDGASIASAEYTRPNGWHVQLTSTDSETEQDYAFVVDASGRSRSFARSQNSEFLVEDQKLALVAFLNANGENKNSMSMVESVSQGWWYSAPIPGQRIATAFICDPDFVKGGDFNNESAWRELLSDSAQTKQRIGAAKGELLAMPRFVSAESGILEPLHGPGWVAVGDAAMSFDPIASHGLVMAMVSARDAAQAIATTLINPDEEALSRYSAVLWASFRHYHQQRSQLYLDLTR